jgi:hypothetical protein
MFRGMLGRRLYAADKDGGDGEKREKVRATDVHDRYAGDAMKMAERLSERENDNYDLREKNRQLKQELDEAKKKLVPDGAVVLTGDDAAAWAAYQKLGKPGDLEKALGERDAASQELTSLKRMDAVRKAAAAEKLNPDALAALPNLPDLIIKDVKEDKETVQRVFVKTDAGEQPIREWGKAAHAALWPAVEAATEAQPQKQGTPVPRQSAGGNTKPPTAGQQLIQRTKYAVPGRDT